MTGERCSHRLLSRITTLKIRQAGGVCDEDDILKILSDIDWRRGGWGRGGGKSRGGVTFTIGEPSEKGIRPIVSLVGTEWSVYLHPELDGRGGTVTSLLKDPLGKRQAWVHDLPGSSAGKTIVSAGDDYLSTGGPMAFVSRELHYSNGLLWDPSPDIAADTCFYEDGGLKWKRRYQGGRMMGRGDHSPAHESYWQSGVLQAEEYGSVNFGRHRDPSVGPAYTEYHPTGQKALEVFARRGDGGRTEVVGGGAWDLKGRERGAMVHEARTLSETNLTMALKDEGLDAFFESRREDWAIHEAVAESGGGGPERLVLSHPSGMRQTFRRGGSGVAKGKGGR